MKEYALKAEDIKELAPDYGAAFVTDRITVDGLPVRFMYREAPDYNSDSGWRFMSGTEDDAYMENAANHSLMDVNTIANFDPSIVPFLDAPVGSVFEKVPGAADFEEVKNWNSPE